MASPLDEIATASPRTLIRNVTGAATPESGGEAGVAHDRAHALACSGEGVEGKADNSEAEAEAKAGLEEAGSGRVAELEARLAEAEASAEAARSEKEAAVEAVRREAEARLAAAAAEAEAAGRAAEAAEREASARVEAAREAAARELQAAEETRRKMVREMGGRLAYAYAEATAKAAEAEERAEAARAEKQDAVREAVEAVRREAEERLAAGEAAAKEAIAEAGAVRAVVRELEARLAAAEAEARAARDRCEAMELRASVEVSVLQEAIGGAESELTRAEGREAKPPHDEAAQWEARARSLEARLEGAVVARRGWRMQEAQLQLRIEEQRRHLQGASSSGVLQSIYDALRFEATGYFAEGYDKFCTLLH